VVIILITAAATIAVTAGVTVTGDIAVGVGDIAVGVGDIVVGGATVTGAAKRFKTTDSTFLKPIT
jgi:hypothetical protein